MKIEFENIEELYQLLSDELQFREASNDFTVGELEFICELICGIYNRQIIVTDNVVNDHGHQL